MARKIVPQERDLFDHRLGLPLWKLTTSRRVLYAEAQSESAARQCFIDGDVYTDKDLVDVADYTNEKLRAVTLQIGGVGG